MNESTIHFHNVYLEQVHGMLFDMYALM